MKPHLFSKLLRIIRRRDSLQSISKVFLLLSVLLVWLAIIFLFNHPSRQYRSTPASSLSTLSLRSYYSVIRIPRDCDISKGQWVRDLAAPYYTNMTCFTIQEHQNCMKYGRPDTDYLKWRWQPDGCALQAFDPTWFLEIVRGKTMAFVGDSLARNQMQSLLCLLSRVARPQDISETADDRFKRWYYPNYKFTISVFWSPFLIKALETDLDGPNHTGLWNLYLDEVDEKWASQLEQFDYVVISTGNWFTRPSMFYEKRQLIGCHYCMLDNVTDLTLRYSHRRALQTALKAIKNLAKFKGKAFLRTVSPSHFENGEWNKGGNCVRTRPYRRNETKLDWLDLEFYQTQKEEFRRVEEEAKEGSMNLRLMDTTEAMLMRPDGHPSCYGHWPQENVAMYNDCVHWCLPGPIDMWNILLFHMLS